MKPTLIMLSTLLLAGPAAAEPLSLEDRVAIVDTITDIAAGADRRDWQRVRGAFADRVTLDYTSLFGGEPQTSSGSEVVDQWSAFLPGFDATQHLVTNYTIKSVDGERAAAEADFQAAHRIGSVMWVLMGRYSYDLVEVDGEWKVSRLVMTWTHETGDRDLAAQAAERAKQKN